MTKKRTNSLKCPHCGHRVVVNLLKTLTLSSPCCELVAAPVSEAKRLAETPAAEVHSQFEDLYHAIPSVRDPLSSWDLRAKRKILAKVAKDPTNAVHVIDSMGFEPNDWNDRELGLTRQRLVALERQRILKRAQGLEKEHSTMKCQTHSEIMRRVKDGSLGTDWTRVDEAYEVGECCRFKRELAGEWEFGRLVQVSPAKNYWVLVDKVVIEALIVQVLAKG